jgi:hypothetical protein
MSLRDILPRVYARGMRALQKRPSVRIDGAVAVLGFPAGERRKGEPFRLWIKPGDASAQEIADVLIALSELHRAYGGSGLVFEPEDG